MLLAALVSLRIHKINEYEIFFIVIVWRDFVGTDDSLRPVYLPLRIINIVHLEENIGESIFLQKYSDQII